MADRPLNSPVGVSCCVTQRAGKVPPTSAAKVIRNAATSPSTRAANSPVSNEAAVAFTSDCQIALPGCRYSIVTVPAEGGVSNPTKAVADPIMPPGMVTICCMLAACNLNACVILFSLLCTLLKYLAQSIGLNTIYLPSLCICLSFGHNFDSTNVSLRS